MFITIKLYLFVQVGPEMYYRCYYKIKTIFLLMLLLFLMEIVNSSPTYSSEFLKNALIEKKLNLMNAENLLKNYKTLAGGSNAKNHSCVRSLEIWEKAMETRELWALQSEY